jgi:hypothetical protein
MKNLVLALALSLASVSMAGETVVATLTIGTGAATVTTALTTGTAAWVQGGLVLLQCDQNVFISWTTPAGQTVVTTATSAMQRIDFTSNSDPYIIYLSNNDRHISLLSVSAAGTCKFITSPFRRKPN